MNERHAYSSIERRLLDDVSVTHDELMNELESIIVFTKNGSYLRIVTSSKFYFLDAPKAVTYKLFGQIKVHLHLIKIFYIDK